jgi:nucleotide-binding universal stress UspA family protein
MSVIVCATNAGEDSRAVHTAAFRRAAEAGTPVVFFHVIGGAAYTEQPERMREAIRKEMKWLLNALVAVARDRSGADDVEASTVLRTGDPRVEILAYLTEADAGSLLIGVPREGDTSIFSGHSFDEFVTEAEAFDVHVELVATGD